MKVPGEIRFIIMRLYRSFFIVLGLVLFQSPFSVAQEHAATLPEAAKLRDTITIQNLLKAGADPDERGAFDTPALHWSVILT